MNVLLVLQQRPVQRRDDGLAVLRCAVLPAGCPRRGGALASRAAPAPGRRGEPALLGDPGHPVRAALGGRAVGDLWSERAASAGRAAHNGRVQRPPAGTIPDAPGSYQFKDAHGRVIYVGKAKSLRSRLSNYFGSNLPPRTAADGGDRRDRRVDPGPQRRRGVHARVQPHQAAPAALQHPAGRRQELPVPRGDGRRRVAPAAGDAGRPAQGRPLLRALRPRLRDPRDPRPAAAHLPGAHLLGQQARAPPEARPAVPPVPHREVLGAVRRRDRQGALRRAGRRAHPVPRGRHRHGRQAARDRDAGGRRRARVRAGRPAAATG